MCFIRVLKNDDLQANTAIQIKAEIMTLKMMMMMMMMMMIIIENVMTFFKIMKLTQAKINWIKVTKINATCFN